MDKPAYTETIEHPEVGHWEPIPENPDEQEPETPQNPDEQEPETPLNPDEQEPETPLNPDEQEPETPDNNQNNNENNNQNENDSQNNNENTSQNNNSSETNNSQDDSTGKQPPKTGDPTSFASLLALMRILPRITTVLKQITVRMILQENSHRKQAIPQALLPFLHSL